MGRESMGESAKQDNEPWSDMGEWAEKHPFDPSLYESESAWRAANHFDGNRENVFVEAAGAVLSDVEADEYFRQARLEAREKGISQHAALLEVSFKNSEDEKALEALETYEQMSVIDTIEREKDYDTGIAKGMLKMAEFTRGRYDYRKEHYGSDSMTQLDEFNTGAFVYLESEIEDYLIMGEQKQNKDPLSVVMKRKYDSLKSKAELLERQGKILSETDALTAKGLEFGLNNLAIIMDDYENKKEMLNSVLSGR